MKAGLCTDCAHNNTSDARPAVVVCACDSPSRGNSTAGIVSLPHSFALPAHQYQQIASTEQQEAPLVKRRPKAAPAHVKGPTGMPNKTHPGPHTLCLRSGLSSLISTSCWNWPTFSRRFRSSLIWMAGRQVGGLSESGREGQEHASGCVRANAVRTVQLLAQTALLRAVPRVAHIPGNHG